MRSTTDAPIHGRLVMGVAGALLAAVAMVGSSSTASTGVGGSVETGAVHGGPTLAELANERIGLRRSDLVRLDIDATPEVAKQIVLRLDERFVTLDLESHSLRADFFRVLHSDRNGGLTEVDPEPVRTYRGVIAGDEGSVVAGGIGDDGMTVRIVTGDGREYWVEPVAPHLTGILDPGMAAAIDGMHVVYRNEDLIDGGFECGTANLANEAVRFADGDGTASPSGGNAVCEIAFDVDNRYILFNPQPVERIEAIFETVAMTYENDVDVTYELTTFILRTEPYYQQPPSSIDTYLAQFRSEWNSHQQGVVRDVAELFTGWNLSGGVAGIAYIAGICNTNGYNVVENRIAVAERAHVSTHELGHNWSAQHCSCSGFIMNASFPPTSTVFHPSLTIPGIVNFRNTRNCLGSPPPANDDCANATPAGDGIVAFDSGGATTDGPDLPGSCDEGGGLSFIKDVWFDYTAPCTGTATATTCISGTFDTRLAVYEGSSCVGSFLSCNDDACGPGGLQSELTFPVVAGAHYRVRIGGVNSGGTGILSMSCEAGPDCPEDLDKSGSVDFGDILAVLSAWGNAGGPEDLDMSGTVDFGDLLAILGAWGPC